MKVRFTASTRVIVGMLAVAFVFPVSALADAGGDANAGDVWVDTVGAAPGPGHEMDPHLPCQNINLWGDKLADSGGSYTIDGWPPTGNKAQAYSSTWSYDHSTGGSQVIDVIDVNTLVAQAAANGDAPVNKQGYHFKLEFSQDPQKHKTFWVNCPPPSGGSESQGEQPQNTGSTSPEQGSTPEQGSAPQKGSAPQQMVLGERRSGRTHRTHRRQRKHRKHHKVSRQAVLPAFTG